MLVIRHAQMNSLMEAQWRQFEYSAYEQCRLRHPEICSDLGEEQVWSYVRSGVNRARSLGFSTAPELVRFLDLMLTRGRNFDESPPASEILPLMQYSAGSRLDALENLRPAEASELSDEWPELPDETWSEAESFSEEPAVELAPPDESCMAEPPVGRLEIYYEE